MTTSPSPPRRDPPQDADLTASLAREREADAANRELLDVLHEAEEERLWWQLAAVALLVVFAADVLCRVVGW